MNASDQILKQKRAEAGLFACCYKPFDEWCAFWVYCSPNYRYYVSVAVAYDPEAGQDIRLGFLETNSGARRYLAIRADADVCELLEDLRKSAVAILAQVN